MKFVGIDLTSAFAATRRNIDVAVLDDQLSATFMQVAWPAADNVVARDSTFLTEWLRAQIPLGANERMVLAIDGPQGLAASGGTMRVCERILGTPGHTPSSLPEPDSVKPFQGYIRSSIDLFASLVKDKSPWPLAGLNDVSNLDAGLWEIFPGAEWVVLANRRLPNKKSEQGRRERRTLLESLQVKFPAQDLPTDDQNDALVGAYLAWCVHNRSSSIDLVGEPPHEADGQLREGFILHSGCGLGVDMPSAQPGMENPNATAPKWPSEMASDWNDDQALLLMLTDYGIVHGSEPVNAWLIPNHDYSVQTTPPHDPLQIQLDYAVTFSGGRGWRATPSTKKILEQLGHPTPGHLSRNDAVTLRVQFGPSPVARSSQLVDEQPDRGEVV